MEESVKHKNNTTREVTCDRFMGDIPSIKFDRESLAWKFPQHNYFTGDSQEEEEGEIAFENACHQRENPVNLHYHHIEQTDKKEGRKQKDRPRRASLETQFPSDKRESKPKAKDHRLKLPSKTTQEALLGIEDGKSNEKDISFEMTLMRLEEELRDIWLDEFIPDGPYQTDDHNPPVEKIQFRMLGCAYIPPLWSGNTREDNNEETEMESWDGVD